MTAAGPLSPSDRATFLELVAGALRGTVVGDGAVGRAIRESLAACQRIEPSADRGPRRWAERR
jgi:hypothetical protein